MGGLCSLKENPSAKTISGKSMMERDEFGRKT